MHRWVVGAALLGLSTACTGKDSNSQDTGGSGTTGTTDANTEDTDPDPTPTTSQWVDRHIETSATLNAVYTGGTGAWVVGTDGAAYELANSQAIPLTTSTSSSLQGLWGTGDADTSQIAMVGEGGVIIGYDTLSGFTTADVGTANLHDIDGTDPTTLTAVGWGGVYQEKVTSDGPVWGFEQSPASRLNAIRVGTATDIAVGQSGEVIVRSGGTWASLDAGTTEDLYSIAGTSDTDVWVTGSNGTILHWDGTAWTAYTLTEFVSSGHAKKFMKTTDATAADRLFTGTLWGCWEDSTGDLFVVGDNGFAAEVTNPTNAPVVSQLTTGSDANLYAVTGTSAINVWAVGNRGTVLRYNGPVQ